MATPYSGKSGSCLSARPATAKHNRSYSTSKFAGRSNIISTDLTVF